MFESIQREIEVLPKEIIITIDEVSKKQKSNIFAFNEVDKPLACYTDGFNPFRTYIRKLIESSWADVLDINERRLTSKHYKIKTAVITLEEV